MIRKYKKYRPKLIWKILCCICCYNPLKKMPQNMKLLDQYPLLVQIPNDAPSNLKWENFDMKLGEKFLRRLFNFIVIIILLIVTFCVIFGATFA